MRGSTNTFGLSRPADTEADAIEILRSERIDDILDAVVTGSPRGECRLVCAGCDVEVVVQDDQILDGELVEIQESADCAAGSIHEGGWFDEQIFLLADSSDGNLGMKSGFSMEAFEIEMLAEKIKGKKAGIMSGRFVLLAGIAEADDESHS